MFRTGGRNITATELMASFTKLTRALVFSADVVDEGIVRIGTTAGENLTASVVLDAWQLRRDEEGKRPPESLCAPRSTEAQAYECGRHGSLAPAAAYGYACAA